MPDFKKGGTTKFTVAKIHEVVLENKEKIECALVKFKADLEENAVHRRGKKEKSCLRFAFVWKSI